MDTNTAAIPLEFLDELFAIPGNRVAVRNLIDQINREGVTIFAGNGVAVDAGYPRWEHFLLDCAKRAGLEPSTATISAKAIIDGAGQMFFYDSVEEVYGFQPVVERRGVLPLLPRISQSVVTVNIDNAIESEYAIAGLVFQEKAVGRTRRSGVLPSITKLLGTVEDRSSLKEEALLPRLQRELTELSRNPTVFIGFRMAELLAAWFLEPLLSLSTEHFAIVEDNEFSFDPKAFSKRWIRPIRCPNYFGDGEELLLRHIVEQTPNGKRPQPPVPLPAFTSRRREAVVMPAQASASTPRVPQELIEACRVEESVLFAGAGLSARAGVVTWNQFLAKLIQFAVEHRVISTEEAGSFESALNEGERDAAADGLVQAFDKQRELLLEFLQQTFPEGTALSSAHRCLRHTRFSAIVTTNYDRLLEQTFPDFAHSGLYTPKNAEPLLDALSQRKKFLLKLYGIIERPETLIFAPIEYREALSSNISFAKFMEGCFYSRTFFFVGLSLEGITDFLSGFVFRGTNPRKHFALVPVAGGAWKAKAQLLERRYNVKVLDFPVSPDFPEVHEFLEQLAAHAPATEIGTDTGTHRIVQTNPGIRQLVLEDIGPFEKLELDFSKPEGAKAEGNWKILLGDNGVGKSTILKAIAVAMMGNDARSYAARLVRAGKTKGRITMTTERNPSGYITEILTKDMLSEAEVVSLPSRPMEAEGWLTLGFSPLRTVSWASSSGPQPIVQKGRPTADDLLPLISGESDPRMDRLKQWIVNLDAADKTGQSTSIQEVRTLTGHSARVSSVAFANNGAMLVSGSIDKSVVLWETATGHQLTKIAAHQSGVNGVAASADGQIIASASFAGNVKVWSRTGELRETYNGPGRTQALCVSMNADGSAMAVGYEEGNVWLYRLDESDLIMDVAGNTQDCEIWGVALDGAGTQLVSCSQQGSIKVWNAADGTNRWAWEAGEALWAVAVSSDGKRLVTGGEKGKIEVWSLETGTQMRQIAGPSDGVASVAISQDGSVIAAGCMNGSVMVWEPDSGRSAGTVRAHTKPVHAVALSADGRLLASGSDDHLIKLWEVSPADTTLRPFDSIQKFFEVARTLTDRRDIEYLRVDQNFRVLVKVSDVTAGLPIEVLSQGLTSLFGWVGVLCQRLKETLQNPTNDPLPTNSFALVLIDELDAHMHPRWQQALVHRLKTVFPNIQFIACTHSPLIVGGLEKHEVVRFALQNGHVEMVDFFPDMTLGRTDQILAGELFDLPTTLDVRTQEAMTEYEELLGKSDRSDAEDRRFLELGRMIEERIPPSPSTPLERRAAELLEELDPALGQLKQASREKVAEKMLRLREAMQSGGEQ
ncbi:MAG: SIR2 family protein [Acidobacteria bacterium]|nr:SIR2 family protein [Acidobacteriota bacterium]